MPLNLHSSSGSFVPFMKFNAKAGRFYARFKDVQGDVELPTPLKLAVDFEHIQTGWIKFAQTGGPPEVLWDSTLQQESERPSDKHKRGFRVLVYGTQQVPGAGNQRVGTREVMANSGVFIESINAMYGEYEAQAQAHAGEVPVFQCAKTESVKGQHGVNYRPVFTLERWVSRDVCAGLDEALDVWRSNQNASPAEAGAGVEDQTAYHDEPYLEDDIPF